MTKKCEPSPAHGYPMQVDMIDLKIRVPPHLAQKFAPPPPPIPELQPEESPVAIISGTISGSLSRPYVPMAACVMSLVPLFISLAVPPDHRVTSPASNDSTSSRCIHLILTPFTAPVLIGFHIHHRVCRWYTCAMGCMSLFLGNTVATGILDCSSSVFCRGSCRLWGISAAISLAAIQLLCLVSKSNMVLVMVSTASAVIVCQCGLALIAPVLPVLTMSYRCYISTSMPIIWLFWQATTTAAARLLS